MSFLTACTALIDSLGRGSQHRESTRLHVATLCSGPEASLPRVEVTWKSHAEETTWPKRHTVFADQVCSAQKRSRQTERVQRSRVPSHYIHVRKRSTRILRQASPPQPSLPEDRTAPSFCRIC